MADNTIKRVRVLIDGSAFDLTYDGTKWSGSFVAPNRTSYNEPDGVFHAALEITNIADVTGVQYYPELDIKVLEKVPPTTEIFWPPNGLYTQDVNMLCIMRLRDVEAGISPDSISVKLNGVVVDHEAVEVANGYDVYYTLPQPDDGMFTVEVSCVDNDGNPSNVSTSVFWLVTDRKLKMDWQSTDYLNAEDLNRIETCAEAIERYLNYYGQHIQGSYAQHEVGEEYTPTNCNRLRATIDSMRTGLVPWRDIVFNGTLDSEQLNAWEFDLDSLLDWILKSTSAYMYSGEIYGGEV